MVKRTQNVIDLFDKYAIQYQEKYMDVGLYSDAIDILCKWVNKSDAIILEIACGPGNLTSYILNQNPKYDILGIDISPAMVELAKKNNPLAKFKTMDCRNIDQLVTKYDGIVGGFCLPYLNRDEAEKFIHDCSALLNSKGVIYLSTMEGDYKNSGYEISKSNPDDKLYTHYYQAQYLIDVLKQNNFRKVKLICQKNPEPKSKPIIDLLIIAKK